MGVRFEDETGGEYSRGRDDESREAVGLLVREAVFLPRSGWVGMGLRGKRKRGKEAGTSVERARAGRTSAEGRARGFRDWLGDSRRATRKLTV